MRGGWGSYNLVVFIILLIYKENYGSTEDIRSKTILNRWKPGLLQSWHSKFPERKPTKQPFQPLRPVAKPPGETYDEPPVPEDSKYEMNVGTCLLHLYEPCNNSKLLFYFFSKDDPSVPVLLNTSDSESLTESGLSPILPTKIIIHGYSGSLYYEPTFKIAKAYLESSEVNVIVLDWGAYTNLPCYPSAVINTWQSGKCAAQALYEMAAWSEKPGRFLNRLHLIGFSLGAHVAGFAASYLRPARIGRITGLDPALPFFASLSRSWKLDANDAKFVDVIHTNVGFFGKIDHTGHVDFYPNGGSFQPACNNSRRPLCNHLMAPAYFAESISSTSPGFWGTSCYSFLYYVLGWCDSPDQKPVTIVNMGERCPRSARGVYFVTTGAESPYGLGPISENVALLAEDVQAVISEGVTEEEIENEELFLNNSIAF